MKRQCTDPQSYPNTIASAVSPAMFTDNHQVLQPDLPYNTSPPLQPAFPDIQIPEQSRLTQPDPKPNKNSDGASIETPRRPRGRPPGSKNKPKTPNPNPNRITQSDPNQTNQPTHQILEIPNGADVIQSIAKHAAQLNTTLRILQVSGSVTDVNICQPNYHHTSSSPILTFPGRLEVVSLSAVFINSPSFSGQIRAFNDVAIRISCEKGEIGGIVVGPLIACGSVHVLVESISNLIYQRLDVLKEDDINVNTASSGGGHHSPSADKVLNFGLYTSCSFMPY